MTRLKFQLKKKTIIIQNDNDKTGVPTEEKGKNIQNDYKTGVATEQKGNNYSE